ncbi:LANO_0F05534g1_1 [Lachancea nothofagi CBS 11611]|uniref:tRNA ligase n=1 Tax=Lachancea nothofagi CBS 11611 TaxID=1266666 RepID=A0A1G4K835_9SACH|nr:LANO_0F05534g1_1 [Lachancea nothofagi CBS 11611]
MSASSESCEQLVADLEEASRLPKRGRAYKNWCQISNCDHKVVSWKFNEWDYGKNNIKLPINARGLFIVDSRDHPRIAARGYDKFFNINEVNFTSWEWLTSNTLGPFEITVKENGCIIFISGLQDGTLLVCSKHSTGARDDIDRNHSVAGEKFLECQLKTKGIDPKTLALALYNENVTAVAEYCDDSFEEHILEYTKEAAGLYLHGMNFNTREFRTLPISEVCDFATKYGFKKVDYLTKHDISSLRKFLEQCADVGSYKGKEIEGFVVRCKLADGSAFFFKFKYEEPYLMYRQWREATKKYIETKSRVFSFKKHRFITNKYLDFAIPLLDADRKLCDDYMRDFGIIKLRKLFLLDYGLTGLEILNSDKIIKLEAQNAIDYETIDENTKFLFFPIATIGCGKTTTALTLQNLYPETWGHVQNDDITGRDKSMLMKKSLELLSHDGVKAVIVDRNNHQFRERKQLFEWFAELKEKYVSYDSNVKIIALSFLPHEDLEETAKLTINRVMARGDRHQSIKVKTDGEKKVLGIMKGFLNRYQPVVLSREPDNLFDLVINLNVREADSSLINAQEILGVLHKHYPVLVPEVPSNIQIQAAFDKSLLYEPKITKVVGGGRVYDNKNLKYKPVYFSAQIDDTKAFLSLLSEMCTQQESSLDLSPFRTAMEESRMLPNLHITLSHVITGKKGSKRQKDMWCEFNKRYGKAMFKPKTSVDSLPPKRILTNDKVRFRLKKLLWNDKIITAMAELADECVIDGNTGEPVPHLGCANDYAHITLALLQPHIKPFYSNTLCQIIDEEHNFNEGTFIDGTSCLVFKSSPDMEADVSIIL